jgi:excisionase family DNA binding protein
VTDTRDKAMPNGLADSDSRGQRSARSEGPGRMTVPEIARRLSIGRLAVYAMLERGTLPAIRLGRRWIITRYAYEQWERTCGMQPGTGLNGEPEVTVLN